MHPLDDGSEFAAEAMQERVRSVGIEPIRSYPGAPWGNGYNERFDGTLRRKALNAERFTATEQARIVIARWPEQYNRIRPRQALNMPPTVPETLFQISGP